MSRSRAVNLVLLVSSVAALEACSRRQCIDQNNIIVDDRYCQGSAGYYHWYSHYGSSASVGSHVNPSTGTVSGVFGGAGDSAGHASGHGGGAGE